MGEPTSTTVAARLSTSRKELLDLTFRNPLLHYKPLRSRGVEVVEADPQAVFQALVQDGKRLPFRAKPELLGASAPSQQAELDLKADSLAENARPVEPLPAELLEHPTTELLPPGEDGNDAASSERGRVRPRSFLQTASTPADLQKRLLNTYYTSRSFIEEQGINTLFLVIGMLTWYEADSSQEPRRSPLILVPVEIDRGDASAPFHLTYRDEEIGENLSLATLLRQDFGITLPELPETDEIDVTAYCAKVGAAIGGQKRWSVEVAAVTLGFFSFSKFLMFKDLDEKSWAAGQQPSEHPLMQALLGGGFREEEPRYGAQDQLDQSVTPADTYTVVDADSSQALAILDVNQGRNLVIQGPPGTGKSQTITNIIAEAVGRGRRVLFVSEKQAALEVVKSRLDRLELGNACLELHSNKSNKKAVLSELKRTMDLDKPVVGDIEDDLNLLVSTRERLNRYCEAVNAPVGQSGLTLYNVLGEWLHFQGSYAGTELPRMDLGDTTLWTSLDFRRRDALVAETQAHVLAMGTPQQHPFWGSARTTFLPSDADDLRQVFSAALASVRGLAQASQALAASLGLPAPVTVQDADVLAQAVRRACAAPEHDGMRFTAGEWLSRRADLEHLLGLGERITALRAQYEVVLLPEAWDADVLETRAALMNLGPKWWRFFSGDWRAARKRLAALCRQVPPADTDGQVALLDVILEVRRAREEFSQRHTLGATLFGAQWQGEHSRWEVLRRLLDWIAELQQQVGGGTLPKAFLDFLTGSSDLSVLEPQAGAVTARVQTARDQLAQVVRLLELRQELRFGPEGKLVTQPLSVQETLLAQWAMAPHLLQQMVQFSALARQCREEGLEAVASVAAALTDPALLIPSFRRTWYLNLMRKGLTENPHLASFNSASHEKVIEQFRALDIRLLGHNRARLAQRHWDDLPSGRGDGQMRVLTREFEKKARHIPLRKLLSEAGRAVQAIKPVFMMSPLSVAAYLVPGDLEFDLVVFDEASQVKPVDAFGALLRGRQAVVVGDSKQLPPTNFFDVLTGADGDEDGLNVTQDLESVLGMFVAQGAPQRMLKWHYRSRHESLIAVSNQEFYDNALVIFPSPDAAREHLGLRYHLLPETVYDRGRSGTNPKEAAAVADAVMAHARAQVRKPVSEWLTLGVAAFSVAQMQAVLDQLEVRRRQDPSCEPFFNTSINEPFFVKNLENVQGDERDIIYISLGYGRDAYGKVAMNFGPLNGQGGERRLNVLITRARLRCEVFTNLTPDDIDLNSTQSLGVRALKHFLAYARSGQLDLSVPSGREPDSPFEREVIKLLKSLNYQVVPQVGCAGYFIDMAVVDPDHPGRYILGVECDGATYHSARSARDRDRLREQVLRAQGWKLHRIWSTDFIHHPADELRRLQEAIESERRASAAPTEEYVLPGPSVAAPGAIERTVTAREPEAIPPYVRASLAPIVRWGDGTFSLFECAERVVQVVETESPVHVQEVARRVGEAAGVGRVTERFRTMVERACVMAAGDGRIRREGEFLWQPQMTTPPLRNRLDLDGASRKLVLIAPEEIALAVERVLEDAFGMSVEELPKSVSRLLGFERLTQEMKDHLDGQVAALAARGRLSISNGEVTLPR